MAEEKHEQAAEKQSEQKNQDWKKWWFWAIVAVIAIAWAIDFANNDDQSQPAAANQQQQEQQQEQKEWPDVELNQDTVKAALEKAKGTNVVQVNNDTLKKIEIGDNAGTQDQNDKIVNVYIDPGTVWDETDYAKKMASTIVAYSEQLFQHPEVSMVRVWGVTIFTDQYGNESEDTAVRIEWDRDTAEQVNYENFKDMVITDYTRAYDLASNYYIHPGVYQHLKDFALPAQGGK